MSFRGPFPRRRAGGEDRWLFGALGRFVERQSENLLTQAFVGLFNTREVFRESFCRLLKGQGLTLGVGAGELVSKAQILRRRSKTGYQIVDAELQDRTGKRFATIECKLEAAFSRPQARGYARLLRGKRNSWLVVITKYGKDGELLRCLPRRKTIWLTWSELGEQYQCAARSQVDRFLSEEFSAMLKRYGIGDVRPLTEGDWQKLAQINKLASVKSDFALHIDSVDCLRVVMERLVAHRDAAWASLGQEGWMPVCRAFLWPEVDDDDGPHVTIEAGYYLRQAMKHVRERSLWVGLNCSQKPVLFTSRVVIYKGGDFDYEDDLTWSPRKTFMLFQSPISEAEEMVRAKMARALGSFRRSRFYKSR